LFVDSLSADYMLLSYIKMIGERHPYLMKALYVFGILVAAVVFFVINSYPVWRFATMIENAIASDTVSSSSNYSSGISSSTQSQEKEETVPDHGTLIGLWVGLSYALLDLVSLGLSSYVKGEYRILQFICRWMCRIAYQILTTILWVDPVVVIWEIVNAVNPRAHGDAQHGNGALISAIVVGSFAILVTVVHIISALTLFTKHITITSPKVKESFTLAHISDVHIGSRTKMWLKRVVKKVNSEHCDALVITGDLFDTPGVQNHELDPIFDVKSPVYAVTGNHDLATGETCARLHKHTREKLNIIDGLAIPVPGKSGAMILGIEDYDDKETYLDEVRRLAKNLDDQHNSGYRVLLNHRPWGFHHMVREQLADLLLSGHTHAGGQLFMFIPLVIFYFPLFHGLYTIGDRHMFCSPGTGTWGPYAREWGFNLVTYITVKPPAEDATRDIVETDVSERLCADVTDE